MTDRHAKPRSSIEPPVAEPRSEFTPESIEDDETDSLNAVDSNDGEPVDWGGDDLEAAYQRALDTLATVETDVTDWPEPIAAGDRFNTDDENPAANTQTPSTTPHIDESDHSTPLPFSHLERSGSSLALNTSRDGNTVDAASESAASPSTSAVSAPNEQDRSPSTSATDELPVSVAQIVEACLFVGGVTLSAKKLAQTIRLDFDTQHIEAIIEQLNSQYFAEDRPYEIRLVDSSYALCLRDEYEAVRHRVFGLGPKEVKLPQDVLEVLAIVAYQQPVADDDFASYGKPGAGAQLRQLLRRDLVAIERDPAQPKRVHYRTTARFLSLFGIGSLAELPRPESLSMK